MYTDNDILFPHHVIPTLKHLRGPQWQELVERICELPQNHEETLAFMLTVIRLNGCMACETDSYRAMRGCTSCAHQTLRRYKGDDEELLKMFEQARSDIIDFAHQNPNQDVALLSPIIEESHP